MDRPDRRPVASHGDQRRDDARAGLLAALALGARYRGQSAIAATGAGGALVLVLAYAIANGAGGH